MNDVVKTSLLQMIDGDMPEPDAIRDCFNAIMDGDVRQIQMSAFLVALKMRGERVEDLSLIHI